MDVTSVFNAGGVLIPNPRYTKSKKDSEPKYLRVADLDRAIDTSGSAMADIAYDAASKYQDIIGNSEEIAKQERYGVVVNKYDTQESIDAQLAENQSNWAKAKNALLQTVVSEVGIGTIKAFSDIFDAIIGRATDEINDYSNPLSQTLSNWQKEIRENIAPIYADPNIDINNGGLANWGWWMKNLPSIASSITLLIPGRGLSTGIAKGFNFVNRLSGLGNNTLSRRLARGITKIAGVKETEAGIRLNRLGEALNSSKSIELTNAITKDLTTAGVMRIAENYQEARQTYEDVYEIASAKLNAMSDAEFTEWYNRHKDEVSEEDFANNDRETIAKKLANESANTTFKGDLWNITFDVLQLWGLRDATKIFKNVSSTKILADHRKSIEQIGKSAEDITKLASDASALSKFGNTVKDVLRGTGKAALTESTEGIEEVINYIAQQEGITAGKILLDEASPTNFSTRLTSYFHSPELWESAFWGLMGGVVFQGLGSSYNQYTLKKNVKKKQEERKQNEKTKEEVKPSAWYELEELPGIKAARAVINKRNSRTTDMFGKMARIDDGVNIYAKEDPITKQTPKFEGTAEQIRVAKARAKQSVMSEYLADIVTEAMHSGTYDSLMDYFSSDQMKQAMIDNGVVSQSEANEFVSAMKDNADCIKTTYAEQLRHLSSQANYINYTNGNKESKVIPIEYVQIIAKENLDHILVRENLNGQEEIVDAEISKITASDVLKDVLDETVSYTDIMTLGSISSTYSELEAQKRKINSDNELSALDKLIAKSSIERRQKVLLSKLETITKIGGKVSPSIGRVLFTLQAAARASYNEQGRVVYDIPTEDFEKTDKELLEQAGYFLSDIELEDAAKLSQNYNSNLSVVDNLLQETRKEIDENNEEEKKLKETSIRLYDLYKQRANIEVAKALNDSEINTNQNEFIHRVDEIHNQINEARKQAVEKAGDVVIDVYDKYKKLNEGYKINTAVSLILDGKRTQAENYMKKNFTEDEAEKLIDAFDILNITSDNNIQLARYIKNLIEGKDIIDRQLAKEGVDDEIISGEEIVDNIENKTTDTEEKEEIVDENKKEKKAKKQRRKNRRERKKEMRARKRAEREAALMAEKERENNGESSEQISSTGEVTEEVNPEDETPPSPYPLKDLIVELDEAIAEVTPNLIKAIKNDANFDINGTIESMKQKALDSQKDNITPEQYEELSKILTDKLNNLANNLKQVQAILNKKDATLTESAEAVSLASKIGIVGEEKLPDIIIEGIENFIDKYLDASLTPIKDGKKVINVEELLRIVRQSVNDDVVVDYVLEKLKKYLSDESVRKKYHIIDPVTLKKDTVNINTESDKKDAEYKRQEMRINIIDYINFYNDENNTTKEESEKYFEILDSLKAGDTLDLTFDGNYIFISKDGIVIGSGAIPNINGNTFEQYNMGWYEDVALNQGGEIVSGALERYKELLTSEDVACVEIRNIILDAISLGSVDENLIKKFINSSYIQNILKSNPEIFVKKGKDLDTRAASMIKHLVYLYNYSTQNVTFVDKQSHITAINNGLENYFYNLYQTYDTISKINYNTKVTVEYINDGEVIQLYEGEEAKNHHSELPFAKDAIEDRRNTRLSIYNQIDNTVHVSGHETVANRGLRQTQSVLTLFDRNDKPSFVTIDYLTKEDYNYSSGMQKLTTYAKQELKNTLEKLVSKDKTIPFKDLDDILHSIVNSGERDRISLFRGKAGKAAVIDTRPGDYPGYTITNLYFIKTGTYIRFTRNSSGKIKFKIVNNNSSETYDLDATNIDKAANQIFDYILSNVTTEVSTYGIDSDNNPNMVINKGFIQRRNGKLVTVFGDDVTEYDSYNDFIIDNNLIRVNLGKNKRGGNRVARGRSQINNQTLYVSTNVISSPVEEIDEEKHIPTSTIDGVNQDTYNRVLDVFKQDRITGKDLFIAAIGEERYAEFINEASAFGLLDAILPLSVKYHPKFNYTTAKGTYIATEAATNTSMSDKFVKVGKADNSGKRTNVRLKSGQVIVGNEFIKELASTNGNMRVRAIAVMIHEKLHDIIANNPTYTKKDILDAIRPICDEFIAGCEEIIKTNEPTSVIYRQAENALKGLSQYNNKRLYKDDSTKLEEFLVESITNSDFIDLMNSIATTDTQTKGNENIFTKLINFLLKYLFRRDVKQGRLLEKEIKTLSNIIGTKQNIKQEEQKKVKKEVVIRPATASKPQTPIVKRIILPKAPISPSNTDDDYDNLSNIGIVTDNEKRLDGFLSAIPTEQNLKFEAMRDTGAIQYVCRY